MAQKKKRTVDRRNVWHFFGLVPPATELRARRLQRYQNLMKGPTAHQNVVFSFFGEAAFESDTIFGENGWTRESACGRRLGNGRKTWMVSKCLPFFSNGGGGVVGLWFLDSGLLRDFGIQDMNGIRAADRAVKIPPPSVLEGPSVLVPSPTDECEDEAPERPHVMSRVQWSF